MSNETNKPVRRYRFKFRISYLSAAVISSTAGYLYYADKIPLVALLLTFGVVFNFMGEISDE